MSTHPDPAVPAAVSAADLVHLRRCVELARAAFDAGDEPFGSVLVDPAGAVLHEDRNRTAAGDQTRHPEFELARWAAEHVDPSTRDGCTVYTSGEHCPMCAAAHAWVGLGRIVYAVSSGQLTAWRTAWDLPPSPVIPMPVTMVAPGIRVAGPAPDLEEELRSLHRLAADRAPSP